MSAPTRPCLACEGMGYVHHLNAGNEGRFGFILTDRCPVCLGSGRVEAKPSVRDALADAETLRAYVALRARIEGDRMRVNMEFGHPAPETARYYDVKEAGIVLANGWDGAAYAIDVNTKRAVYCARAAFRAVPGLRGE